MIDAKNKPFVEADGKHAKGRRIPKPYKSGFRPYFFWYFVFYRDSNLLPIL